MRRVMRAMVVMLFGCWRSATTFTTTTTTRSPKLLSQALLSSIAAGRRRLPALALRPHHYSAFLVVGVDDQGRKRIRPTREIATTSSTTRMHAASSSSFDEDAFVSKQVRTSSNLKQDEDDNDNSAAAAQHIDHQRSTFDELAGFFASDEAVPEDLVPAYEHLGSKIISTLLTPEESAADNDEDDEDDVNKKKRLKILDVACGTGPFFRYLIGAADACCANSNNIELDITGVDLSSNMVKLAREYAKKVLSESKSKHSIDVVESDVLQYSAPTTTVETPVGEDGNDDGEENLFDAILANACFGNFYDQPEVLRHFADLLRYDPTSPRRSGRLFVTHPLGIDFVNDKLHTQDPATVPNKLPASETAWHELLIGVPLQLESLSFDNADAKKGGEGGDGDDSDGMPLYFASLERVRYKLLRRTIRLRGTVDTGYGRGGKKLGFPTANLPSNQFQDALSEVPAGVYFGWAVLENDGDDENSDEKLGRNVPHKAVVNVGYSPTFEGQENPEKIVEAHLILPEEGGILQPPDFYGEVMRLQLLASLRPEIKFGSFDALISQISADKRDSDIVLDRAPFSQFRDRDLFLSVNKDTTTTTWIGQDGGNDESSWEFQDMGEALQS